MSRLPATIEPNNLPAVANGTPHAPAKFSLAEIQKMAEMVAASRLFPGVQDAQTAATLMLLCHAEGLHPIQAMRRYHIIEGRPSMKADAMLAEFQQRGGRVRWITSTDAECEAHFWHPVLNPDGITIRVALNDFLESGVATGYNRDTRKVETKANWKKFPRQMLRARAVSEGVRAIDPGTAVGIYSSEEASDFEPEDETATRARHRGPTSTGATNNSGYGRTGVYASPEDAKAFEARIRAFCDLQNRRWADTWTRRGVEIPKAAETLIAPVQLARHLLKWAIREGRLADVPYTTDPESGEITLKASIAQTYQMVAVEFGRDENAVRGELDAYLALERHALTVRHFPDWCEGDDDTQEVHDDEPLDGEILDDEPGANDE
jgi:hypothetical protein